MKKRSPNFLGIGSVRGGSTWLHHVLAAHPDFSLPTKRKELQYFTRFLDKGNDWYAQQFDAAHGQAWIGEITPGYLVAEGAADRIAEMKCFEKFVLILRHPVERTVSHYKWHLRVTGESMSFREFFQGIPRLAIENSRYHSHLQSYFKHFNPNQFLILIFEEATEAPQEAFEQLAAFFQVDPKLFKEAEQVNQSIIPKHKKMFRLAYKLNEKLKQSDLDGISQTLKKWGVMKWFGTQEAKKVEIPKEDKQLLLQQFKGEMEGIETLLSREIKAWRNINQDIVQGGRD